MPQAKRKDIEDSSSQDSSSRTVDGSPPPLKKSKTLAIPTPLPLDGSNEPTQTAAPKKSFADLGIMEPLCDACASLGFKAPTPIQAESIPLALEGRDLIGLAETGSGKTAAFALPILQALFDAPQPLFALVLAPTRELAYQTAQQFTALGSQINVRAATIVGGMDMVQQAIALSKNPHIVVATPGRLMDHLENTKGFSLRNLKYLVLDEADRLLDMDFGDSIDKILRVLPREHRHTFLFSATMSSKVESLQRASLRNPLRVSVTSSAARHQTVAQLLQYPLIIPQKYKDFYLLALLTGPFAGSSAILFARTVSETARLTHLLRALGLGAIPLHGQLSQSSRLAALNKFKAHSRDILCATDVAARGLDIPSVDLVLNYDLPGESTTYVHRVGRTARAGKSGVAISMVTQYDVELWQRIEKALGKRLEEYDGVGRDQAMVLSERVAEGQRVAKRKLNDEMNGNDRRGGGGRGGKRGGGHGRGGKGAGRSRDGMDAEEG